MEEVRRLRERAEHWRVMARHITDAKAIAALEDLVRRLEERIARLEAPVPGQPQDRTTCHATVEPQAQPAAPTAETSDRGRRGK